MAKTLPVSRVVNVGVILTPQGAQSQSLSDLLILGTSAVIDPVERMRTYSDIESIATDFGGNSEEYQAAVLWFQQAPQPTQLQIGRWVNTAIGGGLRGAPLPPSAQVLSNFTAITTGAFRYEKDGGALTAVTGLNFSGATNLNGVAAILQTAMAGVTVQWNPTLDRFEFTSQTTGASSAISFFQAPVSGADVSGLLGARAADAPSGAYTYAGQAAETALEAVALFDDRFGQQWYAVTIPASTDDEKVAVAGFVQASGNKHIFGVTTQNTGCLVAVVTTDIGSRLKALGYTRSMVQYSSFNAHAAVSALARILTTNYGGNNTVITLKFKQEPGIVAESLATTQANVLRDKNINVFVNYANETAILEEGVMANGEFTDTIVGVDWLAITIQRELYNLLYTSTTKIPQTDQGQQLLNTSVEAVCSQGVVNGLLAPGVWNAGGFGQLKQGDYLPKGYYVYAPSFATQFTADRGARKSMPIQVAAKLAGAIHSVDVIVNVNQ